MNVKNLQKTLLVGLVLLSLGLPVSAESAKPDSPSRRFFIGTSAFMAGNLFANPPDFYQLDFGYWLTPKDAVIITAKTWKYPAPLGIPYGPTFGSKDEEFPGYVRAFGIGVDYQRMLWKG